MTISLVIDWASVWVGVGLTVVVEFLALVVLASVQYSKQKRSGGRRPRI
jgi:hypothetical protein